MKAAGELPKLDSQTEAEYQGYKLCPAFFNAPARTAEGFVGLLFRRDPLVRMPGGPPALAAALAGFVEDDRDRSSGRVTLAIQWAEAAACSSMPRGWLPFLAWLHMQPEPAKSWGKRGLTVVH